MPKHLDDPVDRRALPRRAPLRPRLACRTAVLAALCSIAACQQREAPPGVRAPARQARGLTATGEQRLYLDCGWDGCDFGTAVSVDGDDLAVASYCNEVDCSHRVVRFYHREGGFWFYEDQAFSDMWEMDVRSGGLGRPNQLHAAAGRVVAGSRAANSDRGLVWVWTRDASGSWGEQRIPSPSQAIGDGFGKGVAFDGATIVVSSWSGLLYFYQLAGETFQPVQEALAPPFAIALPGWCHALYLAVDGDYAAAYSDCAEQPGALLIYRRVEGLWQHAWTFSDLAPLGTDTIYGLAMSGQRVAVSDFYQVNLVTFDGEGGYSHAHLQLADAATPGTEVWAADLALQGDLIMASAYNDTLALALCAVRIEATGLRQEGCIPLGGAGANEDLNGWSDDVDFDGTTAVLNFPSALVPPDGVEQGEVLVVDFELGAAPDAGPGGDAAQPPDAGTTADGPVIEDGGATDLSPAPDAGDLDAADAGADGGCSPDVEVFNLPYGVEAIGISFSTSVPEDLDQARGGLELSVSYAVGDGTYAGLCSYGVEISGGVDVCVKAGVDKRCIVISGGYEGGCTYQEVCLEPPNFSCDLDLFCCSSSGDLSGTYRRTWVFSADTNELFFNSLFGGSATVELGYQIGVSGGMSTTEGLLCPAGTCAAAEPYRSFSGTFDVGLSGLAEITATIFGVEVLGANGGLRGCGSIGGEVQRCGEAPMTLQGIGNARLEAGTDELKLLFFRVSPHKAILFTTDEEYSCP